MTSSEGAYRNMKEIILCMKHITDLEEDIQSRYNYKENPTIRVVVADTSQRLQKFCNPM